MNPLVAGHENCVCRHTNSYHLKSGLCSHSGCPCTEFIAPAWEPSPCRCIIGATPSDEVVAITACAVHGKKSLAHSPARATRDTACLPCCNGLKNGPCECTCHPENSPASATAQACECGHGKLHHDFFMAAINHTCLWRGCGCPSFVPRAAPLPEDADAVCIASHGQIKRCGFLATADIHKPGHPQFHTFAPLASHEDADAHETPYIAHVFGSGLRLHKGLADCDCPNNNRTLDDEFLCYVRKSISGHKALDEKP